MIGLLASAFALPAHLQAQSAPAAAAATGIGLTTFTANWSAVGGASSYRIDVATNSEFTGTLVVNNASASTSLFYNVSGLSPATTYYYRVRTVGAATSPNSATAVVTTATFVPPLMQAASAITQTGFNVNWATAIGATSYRIDVANTPDFTGTLVASNVTVSGTSYAVGSLTAGTTYYYRVRSFGPGTSASSPVAAVKTLPFLTPIAHAANAVVTAGFTASWMAVTGATGYRLDVATNPDFTGTLIVNNLTISGGSTITYAVTALTPATTYYYRVRAVGPGTTPNSNVVTVTTAPFPAPVAQAASDVGYMTFTANWARVAGATGYRIDVATNPEFTGTLVASNVSLAASTLSHMLTGLALNTTYHYRVRAVGLVTSPNSETIAVTTRSFTVVPVALAATDLDYTSFTANWARAAEATGYRLDVATTPDFTGTLVKNNVAHGASTFRSAVTGLTPGTTYYYRVRADGPITTANSNVITAATTPSFSTVPMSLAASNVSYTSFTANWARVSGADGYRIDVSANPTFTGTLLANNVSVAASNLSYSVSSLPLGTTYYYRVRAVAQATSASSEVKSVTTLTYALPPVVVAATNITTTGFTANWERLPGATNYFLDVATTANFSGTLVVANRDVVGALSSDVTGLNAGTTYYYRVRAKGPATTPNSNVISVVATTVTHPNFGPSVALPATNVTHTAFTANWQRVADVSNYRLDIATREDFAEDSFVTSFTGRGVGDVTSYLTANVGTSLQPGTTYYYRIKTLFVVVTTHANGQQTSNTYTYTSNTISVTTPIFTGAPVAQAATSVNYQTFTANWIPVPDATAYRLDIATSADFAEGTLLGSFTDRGIGVVTSYATSDVGIALTPGTTYYYRVRATGPANGLSAHSNVISVTTPIFAGTPVAQPATALDYQTFTANWTLVPEATAYRLDIATSADFAEGTLLGSFTDRGIGVVTSYATSDVGIALTPGTTYYYRVRATGPANGLSANSNVITVTTPIFTGTPVAQPASRIDFTTFTANWSLVPNATSYRLDIATSADFAEGTLLGSFTDRGIGVVTSYATSDVGIALIPGTTYYYRVRATGPANGLSANSNVVSVTTLAMTGAPVAQAATGIAPTGFTANWTSLNEATGYRLDIATDADFAEVTFLPSFDDRSVSGTSYATSNVGSLPPGTTYYYRVRATGPGSSVSPNSNVVTVTTYVVPAITTHPASLAADVGTTGSLTVAATGVPALSYQWRKNGLDLPGATTATLTLNNLTPTDTAIYTVEVRNAAGSLVSHPASLIVNTGTTAGYSWSTFAGLVGLTGSTNATGSAARFNNPWGVALDGMGNLYVVDSSNGVIRKISRVGAVTTLAGLAGGPFGSDDGAGSGARFSSPEGVAVDSGGNVYIGDNGNRTVRKITPDGVVTTLAGLAGSSGSTDGAGNAARFSSTRGIAVDGTGNVFVTDSNNHTIRKITPAGVVTTFAGLANSGGTTDGTAATARFNNPIGLSIDSAGNLFVADYGNHAIRKITPAGVVTTLAGLPGTAGADDGTGTGARFRNPQGIAVDAAGNVYISEAGNHLVRKLTPAGVVTTIGGLTTSTGSADGTGDAARFNNPLGLAVDASGTLYLADYNNHTIRRGVPPFVIPPVAPTIATPPADQAVFAGQPATFAVVATGTPVPTYQWWRSGAVISGATNATLVLTNAQATDVGTYTVVVTNSAGTLTSAPATLTVNPPPVAPTIVTPPADQSVAFGATATFTVAASGTAPFTYQWRRNTSTLTGATTATLTLANVQNADVGSYDVVVTNPAGAATSNAATLSVSASNSWATKAPLPTASYGVGAAFAAGKLYAISGFVTTAVRAYDPAANTWTAVAALPQFLQYFATAVVDGKIYVIGGDTGGSGPRATVYVYDPANNSWASKTPMPSGARYGVGGAVIGGKIYVVGGFANSAYLDRLEVYDPAADIWTTKASLPIGRGALAVGAIAGKLYVAGGAASTGSVNHLDIYDPATDTWTAGAPMPSARNSNAVVIGRKLYLVGGGPAPENTVVTYDAEAKVWSTASSLATGRHDLGVAADESTRTLFAVGGYNGSTSDALEVLKVPADNVIILTHPVSQAVLAGAAVTFTVAADGTGPVTYQWRKDGVAIGGATTSTLTLTSAQPAALGVYTVVVTNVAGSVTSNPATLAVAVPPAITSPVAANAVVGTPFSTTLTATNLPTVFGASGLPAGLTLHAGTGVISGTPTAPGTFAVAVSATNLAGTGNATLTLTINASPAFTSATTTTFTAGQGSAFTVTASGAPAPTFTVAGGTLPSWATLNATTGVLSGTPPTASGSPFTFTLAASNGVVPAAAQVFTLTVSGPAAPVISTHPVNQSAAAGMAVTFTITATGAGSLGYQWRKNGVSLPGATLASLSFASVQPGDGADYSVAVTNLGGSVLSQPARLSVVPAGTAGTHAVVAGGYVPGATVTITNTLQYVGTASALGWQVLLPAGWTYASSGGSAGETKPTVGSTSLLEWAWTAIPPSPVTFTYTLNVPAGQTGSADLVALAILRQGDSPLSLLANPDPLVVSRALERHAADTDQNLRLDLVELTRVIELYNVRIGTVRTGAYAVATTVSEDGFAPDAARPAATAVTLTRYHTGDTTADGRFSLIELTRVIELYNTRNGTTRTGAYRAQSGTEDGFAPGP